MVCSPEQSRLNGRQSKGPITERGKAIASQNATKHGLLSKRPPVLASEDLEEFQELTQSLVDHYSPSNPVEWHLVHQIAMGIQRQHRLWKAEAIAGDEAMDRTFEPESYLPQHTKVEREILQRFIRLYEETPKPEVSPRSKSFKETIAVWFEEVAGYADEVEDCYPVDAVPGKEEIDQQLECMSLMPKQYQEKMFDRYHRWMRNLHHIQHPYGHAKSLRTFLNIDINHTELITVDSVFRSELTIAEMVGCCNNRIKEIDQIEEESKQKIEARAALMRTPIPVGIELLSRYEAHISRELRNAIEQIEAIKERQQ